MSTELTNTEKYAIQGMVMADKPIDEIATTLGRPVENVQDYLNKLAYSIMRLHDNNVPPTELAEVVAETPSVPVTPPQPEPEQEYKTEAQRQIEEERNKAQKPPSVVPGNLVKRLMINKTGGKQVGGPSIMTPAAAGVSDDAVKHLQGEKVRSRTSKGALYHLDSKEVN